MSGPWELPAREITPECAVLSRRRLLAWAGLGGVALAGGAAAWWLRGGSDHEVLESGEALAPAADHYPAPGNPLFAAVDRPLTAEAETARYCNFYEFSSFKSVWRHVGPFRPVPWQ